MGGVAIVTAHWLALGAIALSYLIGAIPFGFLFARARGINIQTRGSGNIGATNVARTIGKKLGALVLVLDALKGALPVAAVYFLDFDHQVDPFVVTASGMAATASGSGSPSSVSHTMGRHSSCRPENDTFISSTKPRFWSATQTIWFVGF